MNENQAACFIVIADFDADKEIAIYNRVLHVILTASGAIMREWD